MTDVAKGRYYPDMPPMLPGENIYAYTDRLTGADRTDRQPYDHRRFRNCCLGWHGDCTDAWGAECECPCHPEWVAETAASIGTTIALADQVAAQITPEDTKRSLQRILATVAEDEFEELLDQSTLGSPAARYIRGLGPDRGPSES